MNVTYSSQLIAGYRLQLMAALDKAGWETLQDAVVDDTSWVEARHPSVPRTSVWFPVIPHLHYLQLVSTLLFSLSESYRSGVTEGRTQAFREIGEIVERFKDLIKERP